ncbi:unnamed protein product [Lathyrus sativus]|nr:unnamed protein product [Lathyrus sativus]
MPHSEAVLLQQLFNYANQTSKSMKNSGVTEDTLGYLNAVKVAFENNMKKYDRFSEVLRDFSAKRINTSGVIEKLKSLFKEHNYLILEFNTFMPSEYEIKSTGNKLKDNGHPGQVLHWDVLDIICKRLDFEDLLSFSGVCKNWRTFHKSNFFLSEPLLVRMTGSYDIGADSYSFISMPNQKVYDLKMMSSFQSPTYLYVRVSSGYFIFSHKSNSFVLFNPFKRKKMVINAPFTVEYMTPNRYESLLAFEKCSEEYVLVVLCNESSHLYVYRSRDCSWFIYSTFEPEEEVVVNFVVLNNIIYLVTNNVNIGVLNLNSGNIQFLNLKNTPKKDPSNSFKLVNCDEQLLLLNLRSSRSRREVYKIDLSTMNCVKMKSLGDIALFYVSWKHCQALSNPKRFGYESNHVYEANSLYNECDKYDWNDGRPSTIYPRPGPLKDFFIFDWCFRHVKYEVDYSLVE